MDYSRIAGAIDIDKLRKATVTIVGAGASKGLIEDLVRSGCRRIQAIDFDSVSVANVPRQHYGTADVGRLKLDALGDALRRIDPEVEFTGIGADFTKMPNRAIDDHFSKSQLAIFATDRFAAQARGNEVALRLGLPSIWIGLYEQGLAGEVIFWHSDVDACYRCLCESRYEAHERKAGGTLDPPSDGCSIFAVNGLDSIAGMLAIGLLTRGSDNRFGRLIDALDQRNFIQLQLDPFWPATGVNPVRKYLGVAEDCDAFFAWNAVVRTDPDLKMCPDCARFRPFPLCHGIPIRIPQGPRAKRGR